MIKIPVNEKDQLVTSLRVDPKLWKKAKMAAIEHDTTLGCLIDEAIKEWIEKRDKEKKK